MDIPPNQRIQHAVVVAIRQVECEHGVYTVNVLLDGVPEVFHVELGGGIDTFRVRERTYFGYKIRCLSMTRLAPLMRKWHSGERSELPVDLADVDWS